MIFYTSPAFYSFSTYHLRSGDLHISHILVIAFILPTFGDHPAIRTCVDTTCYEYSTHVDDGRLAHRQDSARGLQETGTEVNRTEQQQCID